MKLRLTKKLCQIFWATLYNWLSHNNAAELNCSSGLFLYLYLRGIQKTLAAIPPPMGCTMLTVRSKSSSFRGAFANNGVQNRNRNLTRTLTLIHNTDPNRHLK